MVGAWHQHGRLVHVLGERAAQGTVEYALTVVALLAMVVEWRRCGVLPLTGACGARARRGIACVQRGRSHRHILY